MEMTWKLPVLPYHGYSSFEAIKLGLCVRLSYNAIRLCNSAEMVEPNLMGKLEFVIEKHPLLTSTTNLNFNFSKMKKSEQLIPSPFYFKLT